MRICILTIGTEGDVRPLVALGVGLTRAGHDVCVATDPGCAALVIDSGLEFAPLTGDFLAWMRSDDVTLRRGLAAIPILTAARRRLREMASAWPKQARRAAQGADLLISHGMVYLLGASVGQSLGVPVVETQLMPTLPSRTPPPLPLPKWADKLPGVVNVALGHAARAAVWHTLRPAYNQIVRPALGLPPFPWSGPNNVSHPRLFGYSPALVEPPASWPANVRVTGAWRLEEGACWRPPESLTEFLKAGPPPVYVGFGSMINHAPDAFTTKVLEASRASGKRMILATGWGGLSSLPPDASERIMTIGRAPHDWLFPRMALAVHHGGAGTTAAATWAGIPSVLVPVFGDQPFWAARLAQLGVAPPPLPREKVTAAALTAAILAADSPAMRARAAALGERVRGENGVANALDALAEWRLT